MAALVLFSRFMPDIREFDVHVVSHTHWDREWYLPAGRLRQRLVALIDELIDDAVPGAPFLLDGQSIVLEDYLAIRPERASELGMALRGGALEAGPWYVLPDELIPGGEALVRNLIAGRRVLRALRATPPPVLYCPDSFGHPAALPDIARGFGCALIIAWRGLGGRRWPRGDTFWWRAPSGERGLLFHLPRDGYETGASLPADEGAALARWERMMGVLAPRSTLGVLLVLNGADHHARQRDLGAALDALSRAARPHRAAASSLGAFAAALGARTGDHATIPEIAGELRDSYGYAWTLQGTFGARASQKRRYASAERLLLRDVEPWAALAQRHGGRDRRPLLAAAWGALLRCQPHDSLCGCSTDEVARAVDARLEDAASQGAGIRDDALADLAGHDADAARERPSEWRGAIVVRNRAARPRGGVAELEMLTAQRHVRVGPGSATSGEVAAKARVRPHAIGGGVPTQALGRARRHDRLDAPRHYPLDEIVAVQRVVAWVPPVPGYGTRGFALEPGRRAARAEVADEVVATGLSMRNRSLELRVENDGRVELRSSPGGRVIPSLLAFESQPDHGDLYTASLRGAPAPARFGGARLVHRGPLRAEIETRWSVRVPGGARHGREPADRAPVVRGSATIHLRVRLTLDAGADFVRIAVSGDNRASDHRLRVLLGTGVFDASVYADAAFGTVARVPLTIDPEDARMEMPPPTAPLHRYVSLFGPADGVTIFSDGSTEYEARSDGAVAVTLVRAVSELSREDLPERPGHAGWPVHVPAAQEVGRFTASFAVMPHGARSAVTIDAIERAADDVLLPLVGETLRAALDLPTPTMGVELSGQGLAFSTCKPSEDGEWTVLRCINLTDGTIAGSWRVGSSLHEAREARLDETPGVELPAPLDGDVRFVARPHAIVTLLVR